MYNFDFEDNEKWQKGLTLTHAVWRTVDTSLNNKNLIDKIKSLASDVLMEYTNYLSEKEENEKFLIAKINSLIALLSLAQKISSLREINFLILKNEYKKLKFYLNNSVENRESNLKVSQSEVKMVFDGINNFNNKEKNKGDIKRENLNEDEKRIEASFSSDNTEQEIKSVASRRSTEFVDDIDINELKDVRRDLSKRQDMIFDFFKERKKEKIQLKDLKKVFPKVTSRTIRNDLKKLCERGLLKRSNGKGQASFYYLV